MKIPSLGKAIAGKTFGYQITSKNYGDKVEYSANGVDEWKILYCEGDKVFIISSDYVPNDKINVNNLGMTKNGMYSVYWDNVPDMQKTLQNKLFKAISYSLNNTYDNSKCVSTLLNTNNWNDFVNKYADYAIGEQQLRCGWRAGTRNILTKSYIATIQTNMAILLELKIILLI